MEYDNLYLIKRFSIPYSNILFYLYEEKVFILNEIIELMNNLLSIFIPTYNRCNVLDTVLDRVISAVKEYDVCVQVYDNCSLDKILYVQSKSCILIYSIVKMKLI